MPETQSEYMMVLKELWKNKLAVLGLTLLAVAILMAVFAPFISPYDPLEMNLELRAAPPSPEHLLGTDEFGRDILSRIIYGARPSLQVGFLSVTLALILSFPIGLISGYFRGLIDEVIMRVMDSLMSFPLLLLAIALIASFGPG